MQFFLCKRFSTFYTGASNIPPDVLYIEHYICEQCSLSILQNSVHCVMSIIQGDFLSLEPPHKMCIAFEGYAL